MDRNSWPEKKAKLAQVIKSKTRDEWCALMEHTDVCFAPVLTINEAYEHPHNKARETFVEAFGFKQPAPSPRFSRSTPSLSRPPAHAGQHTDELLSEVLGISSNDIGKLRDTGAVK